MHLKDALGLRHGEMVSLIGAGGKTTTLFWLARELKEEGGKVLVATTTKIFKPTKPHVDRLFLVDDIDAFPEEISNIGAPAIVGAGCRIDDDGKLIGLPPAWLDSLGQSKLFDSILVEADGAASRLFKVPSEMEPVVPNGCDVTVWIMAIKALGKPVDANAVHRAAKAIALLGASTVAQLTTEHIVRLVKHPQGCLKGVPLRCRKVALLNQADGPDELERAKELARELGPLGFERVVITSYLSDEPVKEVFAP